MQISDLMTAEEAAEYLHVVPGTIRNWASARRLAFHRVGRKRMYTRADLDAIIERIEAVS